MTNYTGNVFPTNMLQTNNPEISNSLANYANLSNSIILGADKKNMAKSTNSKILCIQYCYSSIIFCKRLMVPLIRILIKTISQ